MMKLVELALPVKENGTIEIPVEAMEQMKVFTGDTIRLVYMAESENSMVNETKEFLLTKDMDGVSGMGQEMVFQVPIELLKDAGIPLEADLDIVCRDGRIIILPAEEGDETVIPQELIGIFEELGISKDKVSVLLKTAEEETDGKTDL